MTTNPEIQSSTAEIPEAQEVIESSKASSDSLKEEISTTTWTKSELNNWFSGFFERLKNVRDEFKQWHIGKAIAILFWQTDEETSEQQAPSNPTDWDEATTTSDTSKQETSQESTNSNETTTTSDNNPETEWTTELSEEKEKEPKDSDIVSIEKYTKWTWILFDIRYATENNFTKKVVYKGDEAVAKLRYWTIKKLIDAQKNLQKQWYSLKIWDGYRSDEAQEFLYNNKPNGLPVAKAHKQGWNWSGHARWNTIDITLVKSNWEEVPMPSDFDSNQTKIIDRDYRDLSEEQRKNVKILETAMENAWFTWLPSEWWHYSDKKSYPYQWNLKN